MGLPAPKTGRMTEQEENLQALRVLDTANELLQTAERRARLQGEAEREYSVLQSTNGGEATSCQNGTEWEVIITDALQEAEFEGEEARLDAWLERNQQAPTATRTMAHLCTQCRRLIQPVERPQTRLPVDMKRCLDKHPCRCDVSSDKYQPLRTALSQETLDGLLRKLKRNKAPGGDHITAEMLRDLPDAAKPSLLAMVNAVLEGQPIPSEWKVGEVTLLHKGQEKALWDAAFTGPSPCSRLYTSFVKPCSTNDSHVILRTSSCWRPAKKGSGAAEGPVGRCSESHGGYNTSDAREARPS